jgi:uncharacterized secreted repeat protein (TIGR03808 family)
MVTRRQIVAGLTVLVAIPGEAATLVKPGNGKDQTRTLQAAIDAGGLVELGAGTYPVSQLRISAPVVIRGVAGQTRIESSSEDLLVIESHGVSVSGLSFKALAANTKLVTARGCEALDISHCEFAGGDSGLRLERCSGLVADNRFDGLESVAVFSIDATGLQIRGNVITKIGNNGVQVWRSEPGEDGTIVTGNRVSHIADHAGGTGQNGNAINVYKSGNVIVSDNRLTDCAFSGVRNNGGANIQITGNSISRTGEVALYVEFSFEGAVIANNVIENVAFGISLTNFNEGGRLVSCTGNLIRNLRGGTAGGNRTEPVAIHAEADTVISNNVIENAARGISMGWGGMCRNLSATGNLVRSCGVAVAPSISDGAGAMVIATNVFDDCKIGIQGFDYADAKTGDLLQGGADIPRHITIAGNVFT